MNYGYMEGELLADASHLRLTYVLSTTKGWIPMARLSKWSWLRKKLKH